MQPTLKKYFAVTKQVTTQKKRIPTDILATIQSFLRETIEDEINSGKQHTMTEYLSEPFGPTTDGNCYVVDTNRGYFGPFRHVKQASRRALAIVLSKTRTDVQVLIYDSRYLDDRTGNWSGHVYAVYGCPQ